MALSLWRMAQIEPQEALAHLQRALAILKALQEKGALLPKDEPKIRILEEAITKLQP